jgi:hypothetical protein
VFLVAFLGIASSVKANTYIQTTYDTSTVWTTSLSGQSITINLSNIGQINAVAVTAVSGSTFSVRAWRLNYGGSTTMLPIERFQSTTKLSSSDVSWNNNVLTVMAGLFPTLALR